MRLDPKGWIAGIMTIGMLAITGCSTIETRHPEFGRDCESFEANVDCVRVFYGTNRRVELNASQLSGGREADVSTIIDGNGEQLVLGRADIWLPKLKKDGGNRDLGETPMVHGDAPEEQSEQEKFVFITRITAAGKSRFLTDLQSAVDDDGHGSVLLFVHGFNVQFDTALIRSAQLAVDLREGVDFDPGSPVLFSWPSNGKMSLDSYKSDQERSAASAPYLKEFLNILTNDLEIRRINIIAHSMGNRVLTRALETYAQDYVAAHPNRDIEFRIVLAAADVDRDFFDDVADKIAGIEPNVTIYTSDADMALNISKFINGNPRLGDTDGNKPYIRQQPGYITVDATSVATELFGLGHAYYSDNPFILNDIRCAMADTPPESRALGQRKFGDLPNGLNFFWTNPEVSPEQVACSLRRQSFPVTGGAVTRDDSDGVFDPSFQPSTSPIIDRSVDEDEYYCTNIDIVRLVPFAQGATELDEETYVSLIKDVQEINGYDCLYQGVTIVAYGDGSVDTVYEQNLAVRRAEAVRTQLILLGVPEERIGVDPAPDDAGPLVGNVELTFFYSDMGNEAGEEVTDRPAS